MADEIKSEVVPKVTVKQDYYETDSDVVVSLLVKKLNKDDVQVQFLDKQLKVNAKLPDGTEWDKTIDLFGQIKPDACSFKVLSTKIEIKLRKLDGGTWKTLEAGKVTENEFVPVYPTSSKTKKDWSKLDQEIKEEEKNETGDVNNLFSKIFEAGDDNTKKAMIKSLQESGGTVLSTNWDEVSKGPVQISPPDGMEWKKWEEDN